MRKAHQPESQFAAVFLLDDLSVLVVPFFAISHDVVASVLYLITKVLHRCETALEGHASTEKESVVYIGPGRTGELVLICVPDSPGVEFRSPVRCVDHLCSVDYIREEPYLGDVVFLTERMRLDKNTASLMDDPAHLSRAGIS